MVKKMFAIMIMIVMAVTLIMPIQGFASSEEIKIQIDGVNVTFTQDSGMPFVDSAYRTQVPLRKTMEQFGAKVSWNQEEEIALVEMFTVEDGYVTIMVPIGEKYIKKLSYKNSADLVIKEIPIDTAALVRNGRTFLPIRAVLEAFGATVIWDESSKTVKVTSSNATFSSIFYADNYGVPDYGKVGMCPLSYSYADEHGSTVYMYSINLGLVDSYELYFQALRDNGFVYRDIDFKEPSSGSSWVVYENFQLKKGVIFTITAETSLLGGNKILYTKVTVVDL